MLRIFFSHVNGNTELLKKFFESSDFKKADKKICLGDIVGLGCTPDSQRAIELVRENADLALIGENDTNYLSKGQLLNGTTTFEAGVVRKMYPENIDFLICAATTRFSDRTGFLFTSSMLSEYPKRNRKSWGYYELLAEFDALSRQYPRIRFVFSGYTEEPSVFDYNLGKVRELGTDQKLVLNNKGPYLISTGHLSRGGKDGTYALFDSNTSSLEIKHNSQS